MNQREIEIKAISHEFANWEVKLSNLNSLNLYDANVISEQLICSLLNCIYGYQLSNKNATQKNFPAIDLADEYNRVSFQITSSRTSKKIQSTIDKFVEHGLFEDFDELFILILGRKQKSYADFKVPNELSFSKIRNIIDFQDLLSVISVLPITKIKEIRRILVEENQSIIRKSPQRDSAARLKRNLALKKRIKKDLLIKLDQKDWEHSWYEPWIKFKYRNVIIRSVDDRSFPDVVGTPKGQISPWFKGEPWNFYENGLELISMGGSAIFDKSGYWDLLDSKDERESNSDYKIVRYDIFLRIPYDYIVDYDMEPDEYYGVPTIYVQYLKDGMPCEEILYGQAGIYERRQHTKIFEKDDRKKLK